MTTTHDLPDRPVGLDGGSPAEEHPAGAGTPPDLAVQAIARELDERWQITTTPSSWLAVTIDGTCVRVDVDARWGRTVRWTVTGQRVDPAGSDTDDPEVHFAHTWDGFTAAAADRVVAALRAFGVLPQPSGTGQEGGSE